MKKNCRWLAALAVVGTVIGLVIAYICKKNREASMEEDDFEEEDDFSLDSDLKPVSEREYVPLNKADAQAQKKETEPGDTGSENSEEISEEKEEAEETADAAKEASDKDLEGTE